MVEEFSDVRRNITAFLVSLRQSIERPFRLRAPLPDGERENFTRTMLMVEEARIRFNTYTRYREEPTIGEWNIAREELLIFVKDFVESGLLDSILMDRAFVIGPIISRDRDNPNAFLRNFIDREKRVTIIEALSKFEEYLQETGSSLAESQGHLSFEDLNRIVPRQQVAPVQFNIVDGRIVVANRAPKAAEVDRANIQSALEHIRGTGEQLLNNLENSNCDKRLLQNVGELQSQLVTDGNIVKIGLMNMACGMMGAQFHAELPDAIAGMLHAYNASISLYVAQFPEWDQFTQKAASIELDEDDIAEVYIAAGEVIEALNENKDLADPEVPKTIAFVRQFLILPGSSSKRAAFAMIRTIENLVSSIVRHSLNFFSQTAENVVNEGSKAASKVIIGLLGLALLSASGIGPAAMRAGAPWVKQAAEIVQKQIERAAD